MTLESALADVSSRGFQLNNLFQLHDGRWQANLRKDGICHDFAQADSAEGAVVAAISKLPMPRLTKPLPSFLD